VSGRHVILVGLPGSGKSTVGPLVGDGLGAPFVDVDAIIEERIGLPIPRIFSERGEAAFRECERGIVAELVAEEGGRIIAPGGGWAAQPGALESVAGRALTVYLETAPATAALRAQNGAVRPLLGLGRGGEGEGEGEGGEAADDRMRELYAERCGRYAACEAAVVTDDRTPGEVAGAVVEVARIRGGW
jgi:shikimate kinase